MNALTQVAVITKPKGLKGEVHVKILDEFEEKVLHTRVVFLAIAGQQIPHLVERFEAGAPSMARLKLRGIDRVEQCEPLRKAGVLVETDRAEQYRVEKDDLIGYRAFQGDRLLGTVSGRISTQAQDLLEVTTEAQKEVLIPLVEAFIRTTDDKDKRIIFDLPDGLIDLNT